MEERNATWLRVRGVGRERLARFVAEFLSGAGYKVEERNEENGGGPASVLVGVLAKPSPSVPSSLKRVELLATPTAGGALLRWTVPEALGDESERTRALRVASELLGHLEQRIALESRGTGKVAKDRLLPPFVPLPPTVAVATPSPRASPRSREASASVSPEPPS